MDKQRKDAIWNRILLVLAILGFLGTLCLILLIPKVVRMYLDFDAHLPHVTLLLATPAVWVVLALTMVATIALLILKEISITDKGKCLSINLGAFVFSCLTTALFTSALLSISISTSGICDLPAF